MRQSSNPDDFALRVSGISSTSDATWEDFENFPWEKVKTSMITKCERELKFIESILPDNMKILPQSSLHEQVMEWWLGYEGFFLNLNDDFKFVDRII